jgi:hypothetical protein
VHDPVGVNNVAFGSGWDMPQVVEPPVDFQAATLSDDVAGNSVVDHSLENDLYIEGKGNEDM